MLACERCHSESVWKPAKSPATQKFNHDDRKDAAMPLFGSHKRRRVREVPRQERVQPAVRQARQLRQRRLPREPARRPPVRQARLRVVPLADVQDAQAAELRSHARRRKFDLGPAHRKIKCYDCHTKALGEGKPNGACEQCHAKDNHHGDRFKEFGDPPKCGDLPPVGRPEVHAEGRSTTRTNTKFKLTGKHADVPCRACHRGKSPSDFERFTNIVEANGKVECMSCHEHKNVHDRKYTNNKCTDKGATAVTATPASSSSTTRTLTERYHGPQSKFPLVKGHKGVPCADCHTGRKKGKTTFDKIPTELQRERQVPRGLAAQGHARREVQIVPQLGHVGRAQVRSPRAVPRRRQGRGAI